MAQNRGMRNSKAQKFVHYGQLGLKARGAQAAAMSDDGLCRNRIFRLVSGAWMVRHLGTVVDGVAFGWFATLLTRDALLFGRVAMAPWVSLQGPSGFEPIA